MYELNVWEHPQPRLVYAIGADPAHGIEGGDESAAHVVCCNNGREVATLRGIYTPLDFADFLYGIGVYYNCALLGIENNKDPSCCQAVFDNGYPNMYYQMEDKGQGFLVPTDKLGWNTSRISRPRIIHQLREWTDDESIVFVDEELMDQLEVFAYENGKFQALSGGLDDFVMSAAITVEMVREVLHSHAIEDRPAGRWLGIEVKEEHMLKEDQEDGYTHRLDPEKMVRRNIDQVQRTTPYRESTAEGLV